MAGRDRSSSCSRPSAPSPTRPRTADAPRTRSTSCCRPSPATASPTSRPSSAGAPSASDTRGQELMRRLGYTRYVAQGGDVGSQVTDAMGRLALDGLVGIHTNLLTPALGDPEALSASPPTERRTSCPRPARRIPRHRHWLLHRAGNTPGDDRLCPSGFTHRPGGLDDRSRYGQLPEDRPRLRRRSNHRAISPESTSSTTSRCTG